MAQKGTDPPDAQDAMLVELKMHKNSEPNRHLLELIQQIDDAELIDKIAIRRLQCALGENQDQVASVIYKLGTYYGELKNIVNKIKVTVELDQIIQRYILQVRKVIQTFLSTTTLASETEECNTVEKSVVMRFEKGMWQQMKKISITVL